MGQTNNVGQNVPTFSWIKKSRMCCWNSAGCRDLLKPRGFRANGDSAGPKMEDANGEIQGGHLILRSASGTAIQTVAFAQPYQQRPRTALPSQTGWHSKEQFSTKISTWLWFLSCGHILLGHDCSLLYWSCLNHSEPRIHQPLVDEHNSIRRVSFLSAHCSSYFLYQDYLVGDCPEFDNENDICGNLPEKREKKKHDFFRTHVASEGAVWPANPNRPSNHRATTWGRISRWGWTGTPSPIEIPYRPQSLKGPCSCSTIEWASLKMYTPTIPYSYQGLQKCHILALQPTIMCQLFGDSKLNHFHTT